MILLKIIIYSDIIIMNTRRFRRSKKVKVVKKKAAVTKELAKEIRQIAQTEIHRDAENKSAQSLVLTDSFYYPANTSNYDVSNTILISPGPGSANIQQGTGQAGRVGNQIKIRKAIFNSVWYPRPYDSTNNAIPQPVVVKLVLFYEKGQPTTTPVPRTDFFEFNSTSSAIVGQLVDIVSPYNLNKYVILAEKTFKLGYAYFDNTTAAGGSPTYGYFANNDFNLNKVLKWDVTKYLVKNVKFNDNLVEPITRGLWCQVMFASASGNAGSAATIPINAQYWVDIEYEDM